MGGIGSGRPPSSSRKRVEEAPVFRITTLVRRARDSGQRWVGPVGIGRAIVLVVVDLVAETIRVRVEGSDQLLRLAKRPVPNSGTRYSVRCPICDARREVLYLGDAPEPGLRCRPCLGLVYEGDYVSVEEHAAFLLQRLRVELGRPGYRRLDRPFPERPKRMSEAAYQRRVAKAIELLERMALGFDGAGKSRSRKATRLERSRHMVEQSEKRIARLFSGPLRKSDLIVGPGYRDAITATIEPPESS